MTDVTTPFKPKPQSLGAWISAIRPKTLLIGLTPIFVGTLITPIPFIDIDWIVALCALLVSLSVQIAANMFNDAMDFVNKLDTEERLGPLRVTQAGLLKSWQVLAGSLVFVLLALCFSVPLIVKGGIVFMYLTILSVLLSYLYSGGPWPISKSGLGEFFVMGFYGLIATLSAYYLQTHKLTPQSWIAAIQIGSFATSLLLVNYLRDIHQDKKGGRRTLVVRWGLEFGRWELTFFLMLPFLLNFYYWLIDGYFFPFFLPSCSAFMAINILRSVWRHEPSRLYNRYLAETSILTCLFGILLTLGFRSI